MLGEREPPVGHFEEKRPMCESAGFLRQSNALRRVPAQLIEAGYARVHSGSSVLWVRRIWSSRMTARVRKRCLAAPAERGSIRDLWCLPTASVLPIGERRIRYVAVFWAALQTSHCLPVYAEMGTPKVKNNRDRAVNCRLTTGQRRKDHSALPREIDPTFRHYVDLAVVCAANDPKLDRPVRPCHRMRPILPRRISPWPARGHHSRTVS